MGLMKLGSMGHMEQFRTGLLYMNTLAYFRDLEADTARGDKFKGVESIIQAKDLGDVYIDGGFPIGRINIRSEDLAGPITISKNRTLGCNLYCLYSLTKPVKKALFSTQHEWFGDSVVLVTNTQEFLNRASKAAEEQGRVLNAKLVEYYDDKIYSGRVGPFKKSSRFTHQNEYRITIETGLHTAFKFQIGDISDITSEVLPFDHADKFLKFAEVDAMEADLTW